MTARYLKGLLFAFLLLGAVLFAIILPTAIANGRPFAFFDVWLAFGLPSVLVLAVVVGPVVLVVRRAAGKALTVTRAALIGAAAGPLLLLFVWFLFREGNETVGGLVQFWRRLPAEFLLGVLPYCAAGALFAGWLVAGRTRRRVIG